jgi:hypothetical protein
MKKLAILTTIILLSVTSYSFAVSKKADMGPVGSCMRECVQTVNLSANDAYATDISVDESTLDCVNYCNPNLKDGYCSLKEDGCCNVMYQDADTDCQPEPEVIPAGQPCDIVLFGLGKQVCADGTSCKINEDPFGYYCTN